MLTTIFPGQVKRAKLLIDEIIDQLKLDLNDMVILTEMASEAYIYTPMIAALAHARRVFAIVKDSSYGSYKEISELGARLARQWDVHKSIEIIGVPPHSIISQADIVTNLGFVRPIDREFISHMKQGAVIPYMREAWEYRPDDVDIEACHERNIPVMGTNESYRDLAIFEYCGPLATKILFNSGIEIRGSIIFIVSQDRFGDVISSYLKKCGAYVRCIQPYEKLEFSHDHRVDALLIASWINNDLLVGPGAWIDSNTLALFHPECTVIQFVGNVDAESLISNGIRCIPEYSVGPQRMAITLADLGPKPVIDLHTAGLKVGELMWRRMRVLMDAGQVEILLSKDHSLCKPLP